MPGRVYRGSVPLRWWEHFYAHPVECVLAGLSTMLGALLVAGQAIPTFNPSTPVANMGRWTGWAVAVMMLLGGVAHLRAIFHDPEQMADEWQCIRFGLSLSGSAWLAYGLACLSDDSSDIVAWLTAACVGVALLSELWVSFKIERQDDARVDLLRKEKG